MSLATFHCRDRKTSDLRDSLLPLYARLADIASGNRDFGGFIEVNDLPVKFQMSAEVYPRLVMTFTEAELEKLTGYASMSAATLLAQASTPLERLLIATIWKNGDLQKVRHISEGLGFGLGRMDQMDKRTLGPVFKQFGKHLAAPGQQPIADQHTVRAYRVHRGDDVSIRSLVSDTIKGDEVRNYVFWVQQISKNAKSIDCLHGFDKSMFALGKATKDALSVR